MGSARARFCNASMMPRFELGFKLLYGLAELGLGLNLSPENSG